MTGPKRMRPESAEADSELAISYVVEPDGACPTFPWNQQVPRWPTRPTFSTRQLA